MRSTPGLPPLASLRAFEAVGRLLSFRRAGEELLITQSAVSHHIRQLEEALGVPLFLRKARSIELTAAGERYLDGIGRAFALVADATAELTRHKHASSVRVSLLPSFAANWLVPRLSAFRQAHPDVEVALDPTLKLADLSAGEADLAIRYGGGDWPGVRVKFLMAEWLTPVLSPRLAAERPLREPGDLLDHTLLLSKRPFDWEIWAEGAELDLASARVLQLTDYNIVLQAAVDGHGVALGRRRLVEDRLRAGTLVAPCPRIVESERAGYWILSADRERLPAPARVFADWLAAEALRERPG